MESFEDLFNSFMDDFDGCFNNKLSWRNKELTNLKNLLNTLKEKHKEEEFNVFKRGAMALIYAHLDHIVFVHMLS